jgi:putative endonuclease
MNVPATGERSVQMPDWHLYIVRCADSSLYTGISTDVARRLKEHRSGGPRAARYLRTRMPIDVVFTQRVGDRSAALRAEWAIKQLEKTQKEALARGALSLGDVLST